MTIEERLDRLEADMRHEKDLRQLHDGRFDSQDRKFAAISEILEKTAIAHKETEALVKDLAVMVEQLVTALVRSHANGHTKPEAE